jgi:hypothetical protein
MSDAWELIAETRIQKAIDRGDLSNLAGEGRPVEVTEDFSIPWTVRWLLKKSREGRVRALKPIEAKAIAANLLKGESGRAQLNRLVQKAKSTRAAK